MSIILVAGIAFVVGVVSTLLFARRNKNKIAKVNEYVDRVSDKF